MNFCNELHKKLLFQLENCSHIDPRKYIKTLMKTELCDSYINLREERNETEELLNKETKERLMFGKPYSKKNYEREKNIDEDSAISVLILYGSKHELKLNILKEGLKSVREL